MSVGANIKARREKLGITQSELAEATYVSVAMISQIEANVKVPSLALAFRIADKLSCQVEEFRDNN